MSEQAVVRPSGRALSRARTAAGLAASAVLLPVGGHLVAGGGLPPLRLLLMLTAALWALLLAVPVRPRGQRAVLVLASAVSAGQLVVHWAATAAHHHAAPGADVPMLLAHLAAGALTVLLLVRGEAALAGIAALLERALDALAPRLTAAPAPRAATTCTTTSSDCVRAGRRLAGAAPRRGPPRPTGSAPLAA